MGIKHQEEVRGDPRQCQNRQHLCVVLKVTEAGGYIARHLEEIKHLINDDGLAFDLGRANGECHLVLPSHYCAIRAQALASRLNTLMDDKGRNILEAEVCTQPTKAKSQRGAGSMPLGAAIHS
jgi:hypothetical protein